MIGRRDALAMAGGALAAACSIPPTVRPSVYPDSRAWRETRIALASLRERLAPPRARTLRIAVTLREGLTGKVFAARGAVAVRPPDAVRMQLVGPAGVLALDVWSVGDRARVAVPALDRVEVGSLADVGPGRPVGFLRWWLFTPVDGHLIFATRDDDGTLSAELRALDGAFLSLRIAEGAGRVEASRRTRHDRERVVADLSPCGSSVYESQASGVRVAVRCEGEGPAPSDRAFEEPG